MAFSDVYSGGNYSEHNVRRWVMWCQSRVSTSPSCRRSGQVRRLATTRRREKPKQCKAMESKSRRTSNLLSIQMLSITGVSLPISITPTETFQTPLRALSDGLAALLISSLGSGRRLSSELAM